MFFYGMQEDQNFSSRLGEKTLSIKELGARVDSLRAEMRVSRGYRAVVLDHSIRVLISLLYKHVLENSQKEFAKANRHWRNHAPFRDQMYNFFHAGSSQRCGTEPGASLLTAFVTGKASPAERAFVREFKRATGTQWPPEQKPSA